MDKDIVEVLADTMIHKQFVMQSCWIMAIYFLEHNEEEKAFEILDRGARHDNSKFTIQEVRGLVQIDDDHAAMRHAGKQLPEHMKKYLALHYKNNTHHPEHWEDVSQMPEMDIVEMVCDWHARSVQYETDLIKFAKTRQENRFHFPPEMFQRILQLCEILLGL